jgi:chromosome segregation ATPase
MSKDLSEAEAAEADAVSTYKALVAAKTKEFETLQASIEEKMARLGELSVANAEAANDGGDTADQLVEDKKALADLKTSCAAKEKAWDAEKKTRAEEILALADTIKMLNSDEALEMFKKAIPSASASFMQVQVSEATVRARALAGLKAAKKHTKSTKLDFLMLALHGKKAGFGPVIAMIDKFIGALKAEQKDDDDKVTYCNAEFDKSDDEKKALERKVADAETAIKDAKESVATLVKEIADTKAAIVTLDQDVAISTAQRQAENADYKVLVEQNAAAKNLITMAKKRLNKFYNPSQALVQEKSEVAQKKAEETGGVIAMMDLLVTDLDKETAVAETDEKNAQEDYETAMADAKEQRIADAKTLEDKESAKAEADDAVDGSVDDKKAADGELQGVLSYIMSLHADCDWILKFFDTRKQARSDEIDALGKAKDVLNGADYSLLQVTHTHRTLKIARA